MRVSVEFNSRYVFFFEDLGVQLILSDDESIEGNKRRTNTRIHEVFIILYSISIYKEKRCDLGVDLEIFRFEYDLDFELGVN